MEQNAPRLRFPQFTAAWGKKALGEIIKEYDKRTSKDNEDILLSCTTGGIFLNSDIFSHQRGKSTKGYKKVSLNTLILSAQNLHLGNANVNFKFKSGIISPAYNTYEIAKENPIFISEWIKTKAFYAIVNKCSSIGASACRRNIEWTNLYKSIIRIPSLPEQEKIADFFTALDEKIEAKEKKIEEVKTLKKGFLQQLFPQEGETVPRLRFPGFSGVWEKKKMGEIVQRKSKKGISDFQTPSVEYEDINAKEGTLNKNIYNKMTGKEGILFDKDDIVYGKLRPYLGNWINPTFTGVAVGDFWVLKPKAKLAKGFVYYLIQGTKFQKIANQSTGTKMPRADWKLIANTIFAVPSLPEQEKIADFFSALDEKIEAMEKQRDALKAMKKGFLQQMFI